MASDPLNPIEGIIRAFSGLSAINKIFIIIFFVILGIFFGNPLFNLDDHSRPSDPVDPHPSPEPNISPFIPKPSPPDEPKISSGNTLWALYKGKRFTELALPLYSTLTLELAPPFGGHITEYQQFSGKGSYNYLNTNIPTDLGYSSGETFNSPFMIGIPGDYDVWFVIRDSANNAIYESNHITISSI
jgi:hypothetical protein